MEMALEAVRTRYAGRARFIRVDAKGSPDLTNRYGITCLPTVLVLEGGRVVRRFLGTAMLFELEGALDEVIPAGGCARYTSS
jgi:thioredoxin-like negative regulator of GroEL